MRPFEVRIVLVRSIYERNIGSTSRAMSNMGIDRLILVDPKCELTFEAQQAAATGQTGLQNRVVYPTWEEFYKNEPDSIRIAFTARDGRGRQVRDIQEVLKDIRDNSPQMKDETASPYVVHLIFGPEDWGLSGDDLELVNFCACLPTFGQNWSLNLAQAALLAMYTLRLEWGGQRTPLDGKQFARVKDQTAILQLDESLRQWITALGFDLSKRRINAYTVLRRMLLQNTPTKKELVILETVLQQNIRKLKEWKSFQKQ